MSGAPRLTARFAALASALAFATASLAQAPAPATPAQLFEELFDRVETSHLFADSKTFADAAPKDAPAPILARYRQAPPATPQALSAFVNDNFVLPKDLAVPAPETDRAPIKAHIAALWPVLTRPAATPAANDSLLPLRHAYVVPGGRFREVYYWDSYFTMLGLTRDGQDATATAMVDNFADLIDRYGHVPNGARTYYLSRSQPPVFFLMVGLLDHQPAKAYARYLPALKREHAFWMRGSQGLRPGQAAEHVVAMPDGALLNRYWDGQDTPRDESYREDVELARASGRPAPALYRDIRAGAESGWDFSSRWLADGRSLSTIETTAIVPVDLNSLLYGLETAIAQGCGQAADRACAETFGEMAARRKAAVRRWLWTPRDGAFSDYNWRRGAPTGRLSAATLYPLFVGLADDAQAAAVASTVEARLLRPGGLATTPVNTGQQWDAPNGWAPLQWIAISGLDAYGRHALADQIAQRWLATVQRTYGETGKLLEKYDVDTPRPGGGGEYPLQDGFGWTNGVTRALLDRPVTTPAPAQK